MGSKKSPRRPSSTGTKPTFPVVCLGGSAGGLEAFTRLIEALEPNTGMAFVVIQHLDPTHPSALPPLLAKKSPIPVDEARNGMRVKPDHVYVIAPDTIMTLSGGLLRLAARPSEKRFMPIDLFMRSMAEELKSGAIGVILSGTATDGTLGLESIKAEGGLTFAQDEKSAQYPGMPVSANNSGCVDYVLPPAEIARELIKIARGTDGGRSPHEENGDFDGGGQRDEFKKVFDLLRRGTGLDFSSYKGTTIRRRIARRMTLHRFPTIRDYVEHLQKTRSEVEALSQDLLIKVTTFFRDAAAFEALRYKILPAIAEEKQNSDSIRIWVPGCSTGEEVYSIGICVLETLAETPELQCQIFATDVSESAIEKARNGFYPDTIKDDVGPERLRRFFTKTAEGYRISKTVRDLCIFARQDLTKDPPFSKLDFISCRNVLIYMGSDLQKRILPIFHYALRPDGYLMLGSAESTGSFSNLFDLADKKGKIYAKKPMSGDARLKYPALPSIPPRAPATRMGSKAERPTNEPDLFREADKIVLSRYAPAGVLLNEEMEILQFRGHTGPYLEQAPGKPTVNVLKLVREGMAYELKTAADKALKQGVTVRTQPIEIRHHQQVHRVMIEVVPIPSAMSKNPFLLVLFTDAGTVKSKTEKEPIRLSAKTESKLVAQLRRELNAVREELQAVIEEQEAAQEEFKSANEEILSSNEELQSTNEELETAKEELQSANEELTTLNEELMTRNSELGQLNSDITNLLSSISIPILMLSQDLRIRRFTPVAGALLNLIPGDVGRPISDINPNIDLPDLTALVKEVIDTMTVKDREVRARDGRWYSLRVRPYRTQENKIEGATVMFLDIDALKRSQQAEAAIDTIRGPILVLDSKLRVISANRAFYRLFATHEIDTLGKPIYELGNGQWGIPKLRTLLEEVLPKRVSVDDFRVDHTFPQLGQRTMLVNARRLIAEQERDELILVAFEDATGRIP